MNKGPELLVALKDKAELRSLAEAGATAFVVGDSRFALTLRGTFHEHELEEVVALAHELDKKVYLLLDAIFPNALLAELEVYLQEMKHVAFDAIRVADLGAYMLIKQLMPGMPVQLVDMMMLTNYDTVNYWASQGVMRARLAYELTLDEVLEIKRSATPEIEILIQGSPLMFTSRRKLVDNYLDFQRTCGKDVVLSQEGNALFDEERGLSYPMIQNEHGTHIFGGTDVCMVDDLAKLLTLGVDALYIEGLTYEREEFVKMVKLYQMAIDLASADPKKYDQVGMALYAEVEKLQAEGRQMDRGFYYKPTIYKNQSK